jgi:hypothetical protein
MSSSKAEIAKLIGVMATGYPSVQVSDQLIESYVNLLQDIPLNVLTASVEQCMTESEFFPTIAKIRNTALTLTLPQHTSSLEAWGIVLRAMDRVGFYRTPTFDDPVIAKAVDCIGWQAMCASENQVADRAHFSKVYEQMIQRETQDARLLPGARALMQQLREPVREIGDGRPF